MPPFISYPAPDSTAPSDFLIYAKGTLEGLRNFAIRSGLVETGCEDCAGKTIAPETPVYLSCRCGYVDALSIAISCIDDVLSRRAPGENESGAIPVTLHAPPEP